jgi:hypothetical protein
MTKPTQGPVVEDHEEAPNEYLITRRATLLGVVGTMLTPVSGLLSPALAQGSLKEAAEIGDVLKNIPGLCRVTTATIEGPYYIDRKSSARTSARISLAFHWTLNCASLMRMPAAGQSRERLSRFGTAMRGGVQRLSLQQSK